MGVRCRQVLRRSAVLAFAVPMLAGCSASSSSIQPKPDSAGIVWLCRPGQPNDPCTASLDTTVVEPDGNRHIVDYQAAKDPPVDCFYVYPNISHQLGDNTDLRVDPQETAIAQLEASPFSQVCRVFAPMYRSDTGQATGSTAQAAASHIAYESVVSAWNDYLAHYNDGRGVVLIGHSEGSSQLAQLLAEHVDQVPSVRGRFVSAILTGADLLVYKTGYGPFKTIGPCISASQTGCVVGYNAYTQTLPSDAIFGKPATPEFDGLAVEGVCTNPANLAGGTGELNSLYRTQLATEDVAGSSSEGILQSNPPTSTTPWIEYDGEYNATCMMTDKGYHVLIVRRQGRVPTLTATPDPAWGLHVDDPNLAMGNLVELIRSQSTAYLSEHP